MFDFIFKLFEKDNENNDNFEEIDEYLDSIQNTVDSVDYSKFPDPEYIDNGKEKTILILDDIVESWILYSKDFENIKSRHNIDILKEFNIIKCFGKTAGFMCHKFLIENDIRIDYGILDITLGYGIKLNDGRYKEFDGVDIALELINEYKDVKIMFCTAHTLNRRNPIMNYYYEKFERNTGIDISTIYMNKNEDRAKRLYKFIYENK